MRLRVISNSLDIARKDFILMSRADAEELGVYPLEMVVVRYRAKEYAAFVEIGLVSKGEAIISRELSRLMGISNGVSIDVHPRGDIASKAFIRKKIDGKRLKPSEYLEIVKDVVSRKLNDLELAAFVTALHIHGMTDSEMASMSMAMVETGEKLELNRKVIADKHSIGGVPGDKTSLLVVPIVASLGITIPKTSSKAITSPAGTADREAVIMENEIELERLAEIVKKTHGCLVWGGGLRMSPADDLFITIEKPLRLDPLFVPSILSKKKAAGATHMVLDIPTGRKAKVESLSEARAIASKFRKIAKRMGIKVKAIATYADQPLGRYIGPAPEAYEALSNLIKPHEWDVVEKAVAVSGLLISMVKGISFNEGRALARRQLNSGKAYRKLVEIAEAQGARAVRPEEIEFGKHSEDIFSDQSGIIAGIDNQRIVDIARILGTPAMKGSGIVLHKKIGEKAEEGERIMTLYSENSLRLEKAVENALEGGIFSFGKARVPGRMGLKVF